MNLAQTLQSGLKNDPRNKEWEDLNYDQRTDRLMEVVTQLFHKVQVQDRQIARLTEQVRNHEHDEDGSTFTREYLDDREKRNYPIESPYLATNPNPFNVKALKPKQSENDVEQASASF